MAAAACFEYAARKQKKDRKKERDLFGMRFLSAFDERFLQVNLVF